MGMTKRDLECIGFGFGTAVVLGFAAWGAFELGKKCVKVIRQKNWFHHCCEEDDGDLVEKAVNAQDEVVSPEFERNTDILTE